MFPGGTGTGAGGTSGAPGGFGGIGFTTGLPIVQSFASAPLPFGVFPRPFTTRGWWLVDSAAGSNTYPYDTWAKAATAEATIAAIDVAGDFVYTASTHNEVAASIGLAWAGTATNPTRIICVDKTIGGLPPPPAAVTTGASLTVNSASTLTLNSGGSGNFVYYYGITAINSAVASGSAINTATGASVGETLLDNCSLQISTASGTGSIATGLTVWKSCSVKFAAAGQKIASTVAFTWSGGSLLSGGVSPTTLLGSFGLVENIDLSNADPAINISSAITGGILRNVATPSAWSGALTTVNPTVGSSVVLNASDSSGTNYLLQRVHTYGNIYNETTIVRTGGASDGTTPLSWKMVSLAASGTFPITALQTGEFVIWNDTVGSPKTVTVEVVYGSLTNLQNNQIWLEVDYYGASGNPQGTLASSAMANILSTPADITASSATWTTTGMVNPNAGKLQVTFTPQLKGAFLATVKLCKSATTVFVDPLMTVS